MSISLVLSLVLTAVRAPSAGADSGDKEPGILVLSVDDISANYLRLFTEGFLRVARSRPHLGDVYFESLDALRFEGPLYLEAVRDWLGRKYADRRVDLVVALGEDAVDFLAAESGEPWPHAAVLFVDITTRTPNALDRLPQAGGMLIEETFPTSLAIVKQILPETRRVVLVYGGSEVARLRNAGRADEVRASNLDLDPVVWKDVALDAMLAKAERLPEGTVVYLLGPYVDAEGRLLTGRQLCDAFSPRSSAPLFTLVAYDVGCGVVGGLVHDWSRVGEMAAERALAHLSARSADVVRLPLNRYTRLAFDGRQLARWGVPESRLPSGSEVLFREPSLWRDRRPLVIAAIALTLAQALLIIGLVVERRRRRHAELEGRRSLSIMAHLDRRAAMGELAASLAHEINQPLNAILQNAGVAQTLLTSNAPPLGEVREILEDIQSDDARAGEVIRRMRALLEKRELEKKPLSVNVLVRDTIDLVRPDATARGIQVDAQLSEGLTMIQGDRVHLQQVLLNLLINSMESVSDTTPDRRRLQVRTSEKNGHVELSVRDRGTGISDEHLSHVFEAFYTTKGKGLGMGLSIAKSIVDAHDGRIGAENDPEGGAVVWIRLPAGTRS